ncbi:MAG: hypothetical protein J0H09_29775 [Burkholderiales bacterium]|nr:hypothetical protein [Burkholderiales bacterium]
MGAAKSDIYRLEAPERAHRRTAYLGLLVAAIAVATNGCASNPSVSSLTSLERQRVGEMVLLKAGEISRDKYQLLGSVEGLACKKNAYASGPPSLEEAIQGVRIRAALLEADAVTNMVCEDKREVDWGRNCWQTVVCVADAIVVSDKPLLKDLRQARNQ